MMFGAQKEATFALSKDKFVTVSIVTPKKTAKFTIKVLVNPIGKSIKKIANINRVGS